jgi:Mor family transcriptional regulator
LSTSPALTETDALDVIEEEARAVVQFFGVKQCDVAAEMLIGRVIKRLGGRRVYVTTARITKAQVHARIRAKFTGRNYAEIAIDEGISERQVRRIVNKKAAAEK